MFYGQHEHVLDEKDRVTLPSKYRQHLASGVMITQGADPCLLVFTRDGFERFAEQIDQLPWGERDSRDLGRGIFGKATDSQVDGQGRVRIPEYLLRYAHITSEVTLVGQKTYFEIWDRATWNEWERQVDARMPELATQMQSGIGSR